MVKTRLNPTSTPSPLHSPANSIWRSLSLWFASLWRFARPHTIIGTVLSVGALGVMALALPADDGATALSSTLSSGWPLLVAIPMAFLAALIPSLGANVYIVGLNQLTDIEIDRINKPRLPLASGAFSVPTGRRIVLFMGSLALLLSIVQGPILFATVALSMAIGTIYSLPPLRLKRFPFWAALCIFGVRGVIVNLGFFLHFRQRFFLTDPPSQTLSAWQRMAVGVPIPPEVWALTVFVILFAFAIAIFKDIPDLEGDRQFHVRTLTVRVGPAFVFRLSQWVLTSCYVFLIGLVLFGYLPSVHPAFLVGTHSALLGLMWWRSRRVNLQQKSQVKGFYQFIWKLFFCEYLLFPLACLLH
ncbi:MAG: homogentisate phytyltransferase [Cyanobacteria bacterium P01_F01_bin.150]